MCRIVKYDPGNSPFFLPLLDLHIPLEEEGNTLNF